MEAKIVYSDKPTKDQLSRWANQEKILFNFFHSNVATMHMASHCTGVDRANICRFVGHWKKGGKIKVIRLDMDPFTKCQAQFLSTNPMHWPKPEPVRLPDKNKQFDLFQ